MLGISSIQAKIGGTAHEMGNGNATEPVLVYRWIIMTDHPMSCYPGQFEPWSPERFVATGNPIHRRQLTAAYDGAEKMGVPVGDMIEETKSILRAMSGQITNSTGDKP